MVLCFGLLCYVYIYLKWTNMDSLESWIRSVLTFHGFIKYITTSFDSSAKIYSSKTKKLPLFVRNLTTLNIGEGNVINRTSRFCNEQSNIFAASPSHGSKRRKLRIWKINSVLTQHEENRRHVWSVRSVFLHAKQPNVYALHHFAFFISLSIHQVIYDVFCFTFFP